MSIYVNEVRKNDKPKTVKPLDEAPKEDVKEEKKTSKK